ncbi:MAG: AhpC/TSA family protein [Flavobacteriaceae bacterium]|nr:AhpC/TSA family protein [Bacteroidia bacterium]NNL60792.1 AhpC/TSA family protein [Flavobacteriaceae bacterium]
MLQRILVILVVVLSFSCEQEKTSYTVTGTATGVADGTEVKLQELLNNRPVLLMSTKVENEAFSFEGAIEKKDLHFLTINGLSGNIPFILENDDIDIIVDKENLSNTILKGTKENELLNSYSKELMRISQLNQELGRRYQSAQQKRETELVAAIRKSFDSLKGVQSDYEINFVEDNSNAFMSAMVLERMMHSKSYPELKIKELYDALPEEVKQSGPGKNIDKFLIPMLATAEGAIAPNFEAPDPDGNIISLKDITSENKVTLVDFWAAWCGPCRKENPNLVRVYKNYKDKGLEIIGVSLDGSSRQTDPKAAWLKAIEDDGLTWKQVSHLKYFQDPIAKSYNINAIPASFILDSEGKIIAKKLRGQALDRKMAELLD